MFKRITFLFFIIFCLGGINTLSAATPFNKAKYDKQWALYHKDPKHLWNRVYRVLYERKSDWGWGNCYDELALFLKRSSTCHFDKEIMQKAIKPLDEFLTTDGEKLITDPVLRAIFQHDLWAVFDWTVGNEQFYPLQKRLAKVMRRVAMYRREIAALPDNYQATIKTRRYASRYSLKRRYRPYLPARLWDSKGPWVLLRNNDYFSTTAIMHTDEFDGRSGFFVFIKLPGGRKKTVALIKMMRGFARSPDTLRKTHKNDPQKIVNAFPAGTEVALVRTMLALNKRGYVYATRITETVQLRVYTAPGTPPHYSRPLKQRHFNPFLEKTGQDVYVFRLDHRRLRKGLQYSLRPVTGTDRLFETWIKRWPQKKTKTNYGTSGRILITCGMCHGGRHLVSFQTFGRPASVSERLPLLDIAYHSHARDKTTRWKSRHRTLGYLQALWWAD